MEVFILLVNVVLCVFVGKAAYNKNRCGGGWFFLSLCISPLLAGLALLLIGEGKGNK